MKVIGVNVFLKHSVYVYFQLTFCIFMPESNYCICTYVR